ncbi:MAG: pilus assembly protein [Myxococcales bacterium]|nr:pilus assembly protein [Myxococcales bacterium]
MPATRHLRVTHCPLLADDRGTASVEAVVVLPIIAVCWAGIFFFYNGYQAKLSAAANARRTAWVVSIAACEGYDTEANCGAENGDIEGGWMAELNDVPFIGTFIESVLGSSVVIDRRQTFEVPELVGGGAKEARYTYKIMCNLKETSVETIVTDTLCGMLQHPDVNMPLFCKDNPNDAEIECPLPGGT